MKHIVQKLLVLGLTVGAMGCGQMKVEVSVFDREKAGSSTPFLQADARQARNQVIADRNAGAFNRERERIKAEVRKGYAAILANPDLEDRLSPGAKETLLPDVESEIDNAFATANQQFDLGISDVESFESLRAEYPGKRHALAASAVKRFATGQNVLRDLNLSTERFFNDQLKGELDLKPSDASAAKVEATTNDTLKDVNTRITGLIGDAGLLGDPMTPLIVSAPNKFWRGTFNKTFGNGLFGNTDIAVKMNSLGDFTLKGVRNDATKTTPAAFQGALLMTKLAAASFGVPVGSFGGGAPVESTEEGDETGGDEGAPPATNASTESSSDDGDSLLDADRAARDARRQMRSSKLAALQILNAIVDARGPIVAKPAGGNDDAINKQRAAAIAQVKKSFEDNRAVLEIQGPSEQ